MAATLSGPNSADTRSGSKPTFTAGRDKKLRNCGRQLSAQVNFLKRRGRTPHPSAFSVDSPSSLSSLLLSVLPPHLTHSHQMRPCTAGRLSLARQASARASLLAGAAPRPAPSFARLGAVRGIAQNAHFKIPKVANEANLSCELRVRLHRTGMCQVGR